MSEPLLDVRELHAYYGKSHVLRGVTMQIGAGEVVSLLGRNGVGRSTTCKAIMGLVPPVGFVSFNGRPVAGLPPNRIARLGIGYVPEDRQIFTGLTVRENLLLGIKDRHSQGAWTLQRVYEVFPRLQERADAPGDALSGGEQQMLTICRTLMGSPKLIIIDEPTEGLSPMMVQQVADLIGSVAASGVAVLLVEQKLTIALEISDRVYVMGHGRMVFEGSPAQLQATPDLLDEWLKV